MPASVAEIAVIVGSGVRERCVALVGTSVSGAR